MRLTLILHNKTFCLENVGRNTILFDVMTLQDKLLRWHRWGRGQNSAIIITN